MRNAWVLVLLGGLVGGAGVAAACSLLPAREVVSGLLGRSQLDGQLDMVPRNFAFLGDEQLLPEGLSSQALPGLNLRQVDPPARAGMEVTVGGATATVSSTIDTEPPSTPELQGGEYDPPGTTLEADCSGAGRLKLDIAPAEDDYSRSAYITYAVYMSRTEQEAATTETATSMLLATRGVIDATVLAPKYLTGDGDVWVSLVAIDQAGNASERSRTMHLHSPGLGCGVATVPASTSALWMLVALWMLRRRR